MAKIPSYAAVELAPEPVPEVTEPRRKVGRPAVARTLKEAASPVMVYLHPQGLKALKQYALDENTKVHSLILEAVEAWFAAHGLSQPVRVQTDRNQHD